MNANSGFSMRFISQLLAALVVFAAAMVLLVWILGNPALAGSPPVMPRSALTFLLLGSALWGLREGADPGRQRLGFALAGAGLALGLISLGEYLYAWEVGVLQGPRGGPWWMVSFAGRPQLLTVLAHALCALALLTLDARPVRGIRSAGFLAGSVLLIVFANLLGHLYEISLLVSQAAFLGMAPISLFLFTLLGIGTFLARPNEGLTALVASRTLAGFVLRYVTWVPLIVPTLVGWLRLQGEEAGVFEERTGILLLTLLSTFLSLLVLWGTACLLERTEGELKKSQEQFRNAFEYAAIGMALTDLKGVFLKVNRAFCRMLGYSPSEILGKEIIDVSYPEDVQEEASKLQQMLKGELEFYHAEKRYLRKDGQVIWGGLSLSLVKDHRGKPLHVIGEIEDITARKKAEEEAQRLAQEVAQQARRLEEILSASPNLMLVFDAERRVTFANPVGLRVLGVEASALWGKTWQEAGLPSTVMPFLVSQLRQVFATGQAIAGETPFPTPEGIRYFSYVFRPVPVEHADRPVRTVLLNAVDISERKRAEEQLKKSEALLAKAQAVAHIGSWELNVETGEAIWSAESYRLFGYAQGEFQPTFETALTHVPPEDRLRVKQWIEQAIREGRPYSHDHRIIRKDGVERILHAEGELLRDTSGRVVQLVGTMQDVTELRQALERGARKQIEVEMEQARELDRLKNLFLSTISHEMKTPLSLIMGYGELLQEKYPLEPLMEGLLDGARRLSEHVTNMVDYSALLSGSLPIYPTEVNLQELLENLQEVEAEEFKKYGLTFITLVAPTTPVVAADPRRMMQILRELLENARAYTPKGGTVGVRAEPIGAEVRLRVWDTGCGIPPEQLDEIWNAFQRFERAGTEFKGGLGLGLTIVRKLTELHGGRAEINSKVDEGTTVDIYLPQQPQTGDAMKQVRGARAGASTSPTRQPR